MKNAKSINSAPKGCGKKRKAIDSNGNEIEDWILVCGEDGYLCPDCKKLNEQKGFSEIGGV